MNETKENKKDFYTIPSEEETATSLDSSEKTSTGLDDMVDSNGLIHVTLEKDVVIDRLSKDIYKNPLSALRELVNNEARSCRTAIKRGHNAEMHISLEPLSRSISISGNDSMGMTQKIFREVYTVIGRSGNLDDTESGMFGFGRISYVGLSDTIIVQTYARETNEEYQFIGKSGKVIEPMPKPNRDTFGTKVQLVIRDDIKLKDVVEYLQKICRFLNVPVFLNIETELKGFKTGVKQLGPISERDFLNQDKKFGDDPLFIEIENEDYKLVAIYSDSRHDVEENSFAHLIGIPIEFSNIPNPGFPAYVLNIKNERKYTPVASRDALDDKSQTALMEKIEEDIDGIWSSIVVDSIDDYFSLSPLFQEIVRNDGGYWKDHLPHTTQEFCTFRHASIKSVTKSDDLERYPKGIDFDHHSSVKEKLAEDTQYCYMFSNTPKRIQAALELTPNMIVFIPVGDIHEKRNTMRYFERFGIKDAKQLFKEHKVKPNGNAPIVLHSHGGTIRITESEISPDDIRVDDIKKYSAIIRNWNVNPIRVFKDTKKISNGLKLDEYISNIQKIEFETSNGIMTGKQLLATKGQVYFVDVETSKFKDEIDYALCKTIVPDAKVFAKTNEKDNLARLEFVKIIKSKKVEFHTFDSGFDGEIAKHKTKSLGLSVTGKWLEDPEQALIHLSKLSKPHLRELYAKIYDGGWGDKKESRAIGRIEKILKDAEKQTSELEELISLYDATANGNYSWGDPRRDINHYAEKHLKELSRTPEIFAKFAKRILGNVKVDDIKKKRMNFSTKLQYYITYTDKNVSISYETLKPFKDMLSMDFEIVSLNVKNCKTQVVLQR